MAAARRRDSVSNGFVVVDKPGAMTSHDVVGKMRKVFGERRVGHAGTLDPDATGVLIVGVGRATRLLRFCAALEKSYVGELALGASTSTLDGSGEVLERFAMSGLTVEDVAQAASGFVGSITQIPPMVSAVRVGGRHLYELAREGAEVERVPRAVSVTRFEISATADPLVFGFSIACSSGTYVRSLCADLGTALSGGAYMARLCRTAIGAHDLSSAKVLEEITPADLRPPAELLSHLSQVVITPEMNQDIAHGKVLERRLLGAVGRGPWVVCSSEGELLAVYEAYGEERAKPSVVLTAPLPARDGAAAGPDLEDRV